jgi:hypothetical protein
MIKDIFVAIPWALNPLVILVSSKTKKPGPIEKANKKAQGIATNISLII